MASYGKHRVEYKINAAILILDIGDDLPIQAPSKINYLSSYRQVKIWLLRIK